MIQLLNFIVMAAVAGATAISKRDAAKCNIGSQSDPSWLTLYPEAGLSFRDFHYSPTKGDRGMLACMAALLFSTSENGHSLPDTFSGDLECGKGGVYTKIYQVHQDKTPSTPIHYLYAWIPSIFQGSADNAPGIAYPAFIEESFLAIYAASYSSEPSAWPQLTPGGDQGVQFRGKLDTNVVPTNLDTLLTAVTGKRATQSLLSDLSLDDMVTALSNVPGINGASTLPTLIVSQNNGSASMFGSDIVWLPILKLDASGSMTFTLADPSGSYHGDDCGLALGFQVTAQQIKDGAHSIVYTSDD